MVFVVCASDLDTISIEHVYRGALSECSTMKVDWEDVPKERQAARWEAFR
jgi:hypothetical protein